MSNLAYIESNRQVVKKYIEASPLKRRLKKRKEILEALDIIVIFANREAYRMDTDNG